MNSTTAATPQHNTERSTEPESQYRHSKCDVGTICSKIGTESSILSNVLNDAFQANFDTSDWSVSAISPTSTAPYGKLFFDHPDFPAYTGIIMDSIDAAGDPAFDVYTVTGRNCDTYSTRQLFKDAVMKAGEAATVQRKNNADEFTPTVSAATVFTGTDSDYKQYVECDLEAFASQFNSTRTNLTTHFTDTTFGDVTTNDSEWSTTTLKQEDRRVHVLALSHSSLPWHTHILLKQNSDKSRRSVDVTIGTVHRDTVRFSDATKSLTDAIKTAAAHATTIREISNRERENKPLTLTDIT